MIDVNGREVAVGDEISIFPVVVGEPTWEKIVALESVKMSRVGGEPALTDVAVTADGKAWTLASRATRKAER
jgi:GTP-dependent phosphoenolpyruvate carboxykinase